MKNSLGMTNEISLWTCCVGQKKVQSTKEKFCIESRIKSTKADFSPPYRSRQYYESKVLHNTEVA